MIFDGNLHTALKDKEYFNTAVPVAGRCADPLKKQFDRDVGLIINDFMCDCTHCKAPVHFWPLPADEKVSAVSVIDIRKR